VEASRSLGASWLRTVWRILVPNLRAALLSATVLTLALVLGEFTMASLDLWETLPVWIVDFSQTNAHVSTAVAMLSLIATWILLTLIVSLDRSHSRRRRKKALS
jgi:putative spermidine/putrescine transport system permease protein